MDDECFPSATVCVQDQPKGTGTQEAPWEDNNFADFFGGLNSTDYTVQTTDFGLQMECLSQGADPADSTATSVTCGGVRPRRQLRLGDIGAEEPTDGQQNPLHEREDGGESSSEPKSSQDKDDEEERAGKLKDGSVRLCNGEVFFIMDVS